MGLTPRLEFRQSQSLTLTPQLMQSIRLLQLSHLELNAFVEAELLRNPLLEREDGSEPGDADIELPERPLELSAYEDTVDHADRIQSADLIANSYDTEVENVFPSRPRRRPGQRPDPVDGTRRSSEGGEAPDIDQFVAARPSLSTIFPIRSA
jgi:RNA polymerase sigma-54 factor